MFSENPQQLFLTICALEAVVKDGLAEDLCEILYTKTNLQEIYRRSGRFILHGNSNKQRELEVGRRAVLAHKVAEWSVIFAKDKLMLYDLGFIAAKDGDLRKARLLAESEQFLKLLQWKQFREKPEMFTQVILAMTKRGGSYAKRFFRRLGDLVAKPPKDFHEHLAQLMASQHRELQMFLLDNWAHECNLTVAGSLPAAKLPPLHTFKNKALFECLYELACKANELKKPSRYQVVQDMDESSFYMVWRRLGLKRSGKGIWEHVKLERSRRCITSSRLIIMDQKPRAHF